MSVQQMNGKFPHVKWLDLNETGTMVECAILKKDRMNNIYYIQIDKLDNIDKNRLVKILSSRNVNQMELWDAMSTVTLGNGVNALKYFHQLVKVITDNGSIMSPQLGKQGVMLVDTNKAQAPTPTDVAKAEQIVESAKETGVKAPAKRRGRKPSTTNKKK